MTLNHCWGGMDTLKLTMATMASFLELIPWNSLPKTFQDAVMMTRCLECKSIWIDALCIIQEDIANWNKKDIRMDEIYGGSFLNLAASAARDCLLAVIPSVSGVLRSKSRNIILET